MSLDEPQPLVDAPRDVGQHVGAADGVIGEFRPLLGRADGPAVTARLFEVQRRPMAAGIR
jgi:hypothetical protein